MNTIVNNKSTNFITINTKTLIEIIDINDISFIEANRSYCKFHDTKDKTTVCSRPLKYFEPQLQNTKMIRCHKSFMINKNMIKRLDRIKRVIILKNDKKIPIGKTYYTKITNSLGT